MVKTCMKNSNHEPYKSSAGCTEGTKARVNAGNNGMLAHKMTIINWMTPTYLIIAIKDFN